MPKPQPLTVQNIQSHHLERLLSIVLMTPMDSPNDPKCRWGIPTLLWGPPGIGKSDRIEQAGDACGLPLETLYLSTLQPEDFSGVPMLDTKTGQPRMMCTLPEVQDLVAHEKGVLFLDELTCARPAVQGAGLGVVHKRRVAGKRLPGRVRVLAAANPPEDAAGGWSLASPLANRLLHFNLGVPSVDEWISWLLNRMGPESVPVEQGEDMVTEQWGKVWPQVAGLGAGFMHHKGASALYAHPGVGDPNRGRAWASPRSWFAALRGVATSYALQMKDLSLDIVSASVGLGLAAEFAEWTEKANLPNPEDMLIHGWKPDRQRLDIALAAYSSAIAYTLEKKDPKVRRQYAILAWRLLGVAVSERLGDIALGPAAALMQAGFVATGGDAEIRAVAEPVTAHFGLSKLSTYATRGRP